MERTAVMRGRLLAPLLVVGAWLLLALAWTPPTVLVQRGGGPPAGLLDSRVFLFVVVGFIPWMAATPFLLGVAQRFPVSRHASSLLIHAAVGAAVIPVVALCGRLLSLLILGLGDREPSAILSDVAITGLYSVPTYVAVAAIGQVLRHRQQRTEERRPAVDISAARESPSAYLKRIAVREKGRTELIDTQSVDHIDVAGHYLCVHCGEAVHVTRGQLSALEQQLDPGEFARIHRSTLVRLDRVRTIEERRNGDCDVILAGGRCLLLSRHYRDSLRSRLGLPEL